MIIADHCGAENHADCNEPACECPCGAIATTRQVDLVGDILGQFR